MSTNLSRIWNDSINNIITKKKLLQMLLNTESYNIKRIESTGKKVLVYFIVKKKRLVLCCSKHFLHSTYTQTPYTPLPPCDWNSSFSYSCWQTSSPSRHNAARWRGGCGMRATTKRWPARWYAWKTQKPRLSQTRWATMCSKMWHPASIISPSNSWDLRTSAQKSSKSWATKTHLWM